MTEFSELSKENQQELINKLGDLAVEIGLDVKVETCRELVGQLNATLVHVTMEVKVEKVLSVDMKAEAAEYTEKAKAIVGDIKGVSIKLTTCVGAGDNYETITKVIKLGEEGETEIVHKEGEVWLLDFWATWCGPCQKPMAHNQEMLDKKKPEWEGVVRIIGLSIDKEMEKLKSHVEAKAWTSVEHFQRNQSDCSDVYGVRGVPRVMLIDKKGKIVYSGHPAKRNIEEDLDKLAKGEILSGEGIVNEKVKGDPEEDNGAEELIQIDDPSVINEEMDNFKPVFEEFKTNEVLCALAREMPRAFCVLAFNTKFNPKTRITMGSYENFRVLVGPQANIDGVKAILEEKVKSDKFKVVLRENAI